MLLLLLIASGLPPIWREGPAQVPDAVNAFLTADDVNGAVAKGVLLCRVDIVGNRGWDTFGAVDMLATFQVGKGMPVYVRGPEDRSSAVMSVPAVNLAPGEILHVVLEDRDVTEREFIARGDVPYKGHLPMRIDLADVQIECRAVDRQTAEKRAQPALAKAARAMTGVERAVPDLTQSMLGSPLGPRAEVSSQIDGAAAWIGDDDPAVTAAAAKLALANEAFMERARAQVREAPAKLPPVGTPFDIESLGLTARVIPGPSLVLEVTAGEAVEKLFDDQVATAVTLLDPDASQIERGVHHVPGRASEAAGVTLAPGATRKIRLRAGGRVPELARIDGVLVRLK